MKVVRSLWLQAVVGAAHRALRRDPPPASPAVPAADTDTGVDDGDGAERRSSSSGAGGSSARPAPLLVVVTRHPGDAETAAGLLRRDFGLRCRVCAVGGRGNTAPPPPPQRAGVAARVGQGSSGRHREGISDLILGPSAEDASDVLVVEGIGILHHIYHWVRKRDIPTRQFVGTIYTCMPLRTIDRLLIACIVRTDATRHSDS